MLMTFTVRTTHSRRPKALEQQSNNSNYHQPFEGGNCVGDIIEVVENAMFFIALCGIMATGHWLMCVIIQLRDEGKNNKSLPSILCIIQTLVHIRELTTQPTQTTLSRNYLIRNLHI